MIIVILINQSITFIVIKLDIHILIQRFPVTQLDASQLKAFHVDASQLDAIFYFHFSTKYIVIYQYISI